MSAIGTKRRRKHGLTDVEVRRAAEAAMRSALGQQALRESWGRGLYMYVMEHGRQPHDMFTIDKLKRAANDFRWDLEELKQGGDDKNPLHQAHRSFLQAAADFEQELCARFLVRETVDA